jgi:hypothetical protein
MLPASVSSFSRHFPKLPRHRSGQDATQLRLCFLAAFRSFRDITQVRMFPAVFAFSRLSAPRHRSGKDATQLPLCSLAALEASAASSGKDATQLSLCFLAAFESVRGIAQVWMLPASFSLSTA